MRDNVVVVVVDDDDDDDDDQTKHPYHPEKFYEHLIWFCLRVFKKTWVDHQSCFPLFACHLGDIHNFRTYQCFWLFHHLEQNLQNSAIFG